MPLLKQAYRSAHVAKFGEVPLGFEIRGEPLPLHASGP